MSKAPRRSVKNASLKPDRASYERSSNRIAGGYAIAIPEESQGDDNRSGPDTTGREAAEADA